MADQKHLHTYKRHHRDKKIYRCIDPDCTHFTDRYLLEGKRSRCPTCGNEMILSLDDLRKVLPRCIMCTDTKEARAKREALQKASELFEQIGLEVEEEKK